MTRASLFALGILLATVSVASAGSFRIVPVEGEPYDATIRSGTPGVLKLTRDGKPLDVPLEVIRRLTRPLTESSATSPFVEFRGGDRMRGVVIGGGDSEGTPFVRVVFDVDRGRQVDVPLHEVRVLRWIGDSAADAEHLDKLHADAEKGERTLDRVYLVRGGKLTTMDAAVRRIDANSVTVLWEDKERTIPRKFLFAALFSGALSDDSDDSDDRPASAGPKVAVKTVHGGSLSAYWIGSDAEAFRFDRRGLTIQIPHVRVARIDVTTDRVLYLSDADPVEVVETPWFVDNVWPWRRDRSASGRPLTVGGVTYEKGLGTHSRSRIVFDISGDYRRFRTTVGIDDHAGRVGDAVIQVICDGKVRFEIKSLKVGMDAKKIDLDVSGVERLALVVDYGANYDMGDLVDWCDARVVR